MSDPKKLHTSFTGDEAWDVDGKHYTKTDSGNALDTTYSRDDDKDKKHDYVVRERGSDGEVTASKGWPW